MLRSSKDVIVRDLYIRATDRMRKNRVQANSSHPQWKPNVDLDYFETVAKQKHGSNWNSFTNQMKRKKISQVVAEQTINDRLEYLKGLQMQGAVISQICREDELEFEWMRCLTSLSPKLLKFGANAVTNTLPTLDNLKRWQYIVVDDLCTLCSHEKPTITHVLSNCRGALGELEDKFNRIKWRHNEVLKELITRIVPQAANLGYGILADLPDHQFGYDSFPLIQTEQRPDLVLVNTETKKVIVGELTCPMEGNISRAHQDKTAKYLGLCAALRSEGYEVELIPFEVSTRGLVAPSMLEFLKLLYITRKCQRIIKHALSLRVLDCSRQIFSQAIS